MKEYLTPKEVAKRLRRDPATLWRWRRKKHGGPPFIQYGRAILYPLADLEQWERDNGV